MLNVKSTYIRGLIITLAIFGLTNCSKKTNPAPTVTQQDDGNDNGGNDNGGDSDHTSTFKGYVDPTLIETRQTPVEEAINYTGLSNQKKAQFTGFKQDDTLRFTDASANEDADSSQLTELKRQIRLEADGDQEVLDANLAFAQSLSLLQVVINPNEPTNVRVNFKIRRGSKDVNYSMTGAIKTLQGKYSSSLSAKMKSSSGPQDVVLNLQCLDEEATCHNSLLTFNDKSSHTVRKAFALFRSTPVKLKFYAESSGFTNDDSTGFIGEDNSFDLSLNDTRKTAFSAFTDILQNSTLAHGKHKRFPYIQSAVMESATVVYGRSSFALFTRIKNKNDKDTLIPVFGSLVLVRPKNDSTVNQDLDVPKSALLKDPAKSPFDSITRGIKQYTLLENSGTGAIQVLMSFGADQQQSDIVILTISRLSVQLRALND